MYEDIQKKLEERYGKELKDILTDLYITQGLGPSCSARQLGIPRHVFLHFRNRYGLKEAKHQRLNEPSIGEHC